MRTAVALAVMLAVTPLFWPVVPPTTPPPGRMAAPSYRPPPPPVLDPLADAPPRRWIWPLSPKPVVLRGFERPSTTWGPGHRGLDLAGRENQPVLAAGEGRVTYAGPIAGRGVLVVAHPDGLRTTYEPVRHVVEVGDPVRAGDRIGQLRPGGHCAPRVCLHWGLIRGSFYLDPADLFDGRPRLLPYLPSPAPGSFDLTRADVPGDTPAAADPPRRACRSA